MTDFTSRPCPACEYRDGVLVRQCEQCRQAMSPPAAGGRLHIPTLQEAARAVCDYCRCGTPLVWLGGHAMHEIIGSMAPPCRAEGIHRLIEKEQEAQHDPR